MARKIFTFVSVSFGIPALLYLIFKYVEYALMPNTEMIALVPLMLLGGIWVTVCYSVVFKAK